jgi:hypothetical protein
MGRLMLSMAAALLAASREFAQQQVADPDFPTVVEHPAFTSRHPHIGIDEGHKNFHTRQGRYKPFAALLEADGYTVASVSSFRAESLQGLDILVIANALGEARNDLMGPLSRWKNATESQLAT